MGTKKISGMDRIAYERVRQIRYEGHTVAKDMLHTRTALIRAAQCYLSVAWLLAEGRSFEDAKYERANWPWDQYYWKPAETPERNLEKAGALIAAAIDRLDP